MLNLHDRHKNDTNSSSVGFIGFVVVPLYKLLGKAILEVENKHQFGLRTRIVDECLVVLNANKERYAKIVNGEQVDDAPVFDVEAAVTPPGINGEHQQNSVKFFAPPSAMLHPRKVSRPTSARAKVLTERTSVPRGRRRPSSRSPRGSAASIRSSMRLIRPPSRESLVFFAEECGGAGRRRSAAGVRVLFCLVAVSAGGAWRDARRVTPFGPFGSCEKSKNRHRLPSIVVRHYCSATKQQNPHYLKL